MADDVQIFRGPTPPPPPPRGSAPSAHVQPPKPTSPIPKKMAEASSGETITIRTMKDDIARLSQGKQAPSAPVEATHFEANKSLAQPASFPLPVKTPKGKSVV
ncbi:MAG: hypothetical protein HYZ63_00735, partial [Candidatus Andersenbacteria bacterium]|nr:hypothetical protein [Candidatus Andersenbacteria bacterium]